MKRLLTSAAAMVLGLAIWGSLAPAAHAAPLEAADVASSAKWLAHFDFDAARETKIGEHLRSQAMKNPRVEKSLDKLKDFGFDPEKDLHGATLYGSDVKFGADAHSVVMIVYATADVEKIVGFLKTRPEYAESKTDDGIDIYTWKSNMGPDKKETVWAAFPKKGVGVLTQNDEALKAALKVLAGKGGLSSSSPLLGDAPKGTFMRMAVAGLTEAKLPIQQPLLAQIDDVHMAMGENDGNDFIKVDITTTKPEAAKQMKSMIDGFSGMMALQAADHPEVQQLLKNLKVEAAEKELTIDWKAPADEMIKLGEKMRQQSKQANPAGKQPENSEDK